MKLSTLIAVTAMVSFASVSVGAQERTFWFHERSIERQETARSVAPLAVDTAFGDRHSLYNGSVEFSHLDISIPGNSALPVELRRKLPIADRSEGVVGGSLRTVGFGHFADWDLDIPHLSGTFLRNIGWQVAGSAPNNRCSSVTRPRTDRGGALGAPHSFWNGYQLNIPGMGTEPLLGASQTEIPRPADGATYYWLTKSLAWVSCKPSTRNGHPGEAFLVTTPDGFKYHLDHVVISDHVPHVTAVDTAGTHTAQRRNIFFVVSKIEDRFGNWVDYTWSGDRLQSITSNDGRSISITYDSVGRIMRASTSGQQWQYIYNGLLSRVVLPDNSEWNFSRVGHPKVEIHFEYEDSFEPKCHSNQEGKQTNFGSYSVRHPSGALAEFNFSPLRHHRSNTPFTCVKWVTDYDYLEIPNYSDTHSLIRKRVTGPGLQPAEWTYEYSLGGDFWRRHCETSFPGMCPSQKTQRVTLPNGERIEYDYGMMYDVNEGQLLATRNYSASNSLLRTTTQTYVAAGEIPTLPFPDRAGNHILMYANVFADAAFRPERSRTFHQQGVTFSSLVNSYDRFARPLTTTKSSGVDRGVPRTEQVAYHDNLSRWVLAQPAGRTVNGISEFQVEYNALALPSVIRRFGRVSQSLTYNANGTVATLRDGNNHVTTVSNWKRGVPQSVKYPGTPEAPSGATQTASVDDQGWIRWINDENGYRTCYDYDPMGRVRKITYPSETQAGVCDTSAWAETTITFSSGHPTVYGMPAGHWRQTTLTGNARKILVFDALWRPVVEQTLDLGNVAGTHSEVITRYDPRGRAIFQSYPMRTNGAATYGDTSLKGVHTEYDALDRVTRTRQDWEGAGQLITTTEHLSEFRTRVTPPRGQGAGTTYQTTTSYQAWDQPTYDFPTTIAHPAAAYTHITRDPFGKPTILRRSNSSSQTGGTVAINRTYTYNTRQELCRSVEPETGATLMGYDGAGNLTWSASGLPASTVCDATGNATAVNARKAVRTYDARNRVKTLAFPDGLGNATYTYKADGKLGSITADNRDGYPVTTEYTYNRRGLTIQERLLWGSINWPVTYAYNTNGHLASDNVHGQTVGYAPNALGQPTQAGSYATGVSYFPNGAIKQFTYGNGIVRTLTQNVRGLPAVSKDAHGSTAFLQDEYAYDQHANVLAITDAATGRNQRGNRSMTYDALDRLTQTVSPMFGTAAYTYDVLDNLTRVQMGATATLAARDHHYCYDASWRLTNVKTGGCGGSTVLGLGYDAQGNLNNRSGRGFTFDFGNRLRSVSASGGTPASSYFYDGHGRRIGDVVGAYKYGIYNSRGRLMYDADARRSRQYWYVSLNGTVVAIRERNTGTGAIEVKYQHTDALGSPVAVTDANRNVVERTEYEPYGRVGNRTLRDGPGYTGHVEDAATGLNYLQQRYYDPMLGVFLSVDPVTAYGGDQRYFNRYWYAAGNPYKYTDPDGRALQALWGAPVGAAVEIIAQKIADPSAPINWRSVGVSTLVGAATGGIGSIARTAAVRGTITYSQAVTRTAAGNAAVSAAGSAADSSVNGEIPSAEKMAVAAVVGGALSLGAGRAANAENLRLERMSSVPVNSPQGIGIHVAQATQSAGNASTSATQSAVSGVAGNAADVAGSVLEKKVEERIDRNR